MRPLIALVATLAFAQCGWRSDKKIIAVRDRLKADASRELHIGSTQGDVRVFLQSRHIHFSEDASRRIIMASIRNNDTNPFRLVQPAGIFLRFYFDDNGLQRWTIEMESRGP